MNSPDIGRGSIWRPDSEQHIFKPEIIICKTEREVDSRAAVKVAQIATFAKNPVAYSFPTGTTPKGMYDELAYLYNQGIFDTDDVRVFNLDEYYGIPYENPASYRTEMSDVIRRLHITPGNHFVPDSLAENPHEEAARYDALLGKYQVDLAVLGIGPELTCHIAFNEPGSTDDSRTRLVELTEETRRANAKAFGGDISLVPTHAITQGIGTILEAKQIILIAKGEQKAAGIARTLLGPIGPEAPASFLRYHPNVIFILDRPAAQDLAA